jgi:hypothetical protein
VTRQKTDLKQRYATGATRTSSAQPTFPLQVKLLIYALGFSNVIFTENSSFKNKNLARGPFSGLIGFFSSHCIGILQ